MPALDATNRAIARLKPVGRNWTLYVYQPAFLWTGTVAGAPEQGDEELVVNTTWGNGADIIADCTVWVFESTGGRKIMPSKVRAKSYDAPTTTLTVAENAIDWQVGDLVQAMRLFEIWPRVVYINPATGEQFKDGDIQWTDDATAQPPKANGGPAAIGMLEGGVCDITFRDEGSYTCPTGGAPSSYLWTALGGAPAVQAGALASTWVTLRYTTAGYYYMQYQVTDANGKVGTRYIPVIIDDGTYGRTNVDVGDRYWDRHGWALSRRWIGVDQYGSAFYDGAPVFLVSDSYGTAPDAFVKNRARLRWSGWLAEDTLARTYDERSVVYRAVSSAHILQNIPAWPNEMTSAAVPAADQQWYEYTQLSVDSVCHLLLKWNSTALEVCDFHPTGEWTNRLLFGEQPEADDLLSQVDNVLAAVFGNMRCDRQGILRGMRHEWHLSAAERAARATVMTLDPIDWDRATMGPRRHQSIAREVRLSGTDSSGDPYMAGAPGDFVLDGGKPVEVGNLAPNNQSELNQWAGQHLAFANWATPVRLTMTGEYDIVDPALGEYVQANLYQFDDKLPRGSVPYSVVGVRFRDDHARGVTMGEWEILPSPQEYPGVTVEIPEEPPTPDPEDPPDDGYDPPIVKTWPVAMYCGTFDKGVYLSEDFSGPDGAMPTWTAHNTITGDINTLADYGVYCFEIDPSDRERWQYLIDNTNFEVYRRDRDASDNWVMEIDQAAADALLSGAGFSHYNGTGTFRWIDVDPSNTGHIYALYQDRDDANKWAFLFKSTDHGATWSVVSQIEAGEFWHFYRYVMSIHVSDNEIMYVGNRVLGPAGLHSYYSDDYGATWIRCSTMIGDTSTSYRSLGNYNRLQSTIVYCRGFDNPLYELWGSSPPLGDPDSWELTADPDSGDELPRQGVYSRGDIIWFDPGTAASHRLVRMGDEVAARATKYYTTANSWVACTSAIDLPYWNINNMCYKVNDAAPEMIVYGSEECDYIPAVGPENVTTTRHHVLVAEADDPATTYAKAGDDVSSPPYADSIPEDAGGVCHKGIKAVF